MELITLSLCLMLNAVIISLPTTTAIPDIESFSIVIGSDLWSGSTAVVTLTLWFNYTIFQCDFLPETQGEIYQCNSTTWTVIGSSGCSKTDIPEYKLMVFNPSSDDIIIDELIVTHIDGRWWKILSWCIPISKVNPGYDIPTDSKINDTLCGVGYNHYDKLCVNNQSDDCGPSKQVLYYNISSPNTNEIGTTWSDVNLTIDAITCPPTPLIKESISPTQHPTLSNMDYIMIYAVYIEISFEYIITNSSISTDVIKQELTDITLKIIEKELETVDCVESDDYNISVTIQETYNINNITCTDATISATIFLCNNESQMQLMTVIEGHELETIFINEIINETNVIVDVDSVILVVDEIIETIPNPKIQSTLFYTSLDISTSETKNNDTDKDEQDGDDLTLVIIVVFSVTFVLLIVFIAIYLIKHQIKKNQKKENDDKKRMIEMKVKVPTPDLDLDAVVQETINGHNRGQSDTLGIGIVTPMGIGADIDASGNGFNIDPSDMLGLYDNDGIVIQPDAIQVVDDDSDDTKNDIMVPNQITKGNIDDKIVNDNANSMIKDDADGGDIITADNEDDDNGSA